MVRNLLTGKTDDAVLHLMTLFGNASMSGTGGRVPLLRLQKEKKSGSIFLLVNNNDHIRTLMGISGVNSVDQQRNLSVMFSFKESSGCTSSLTTTLIYHSLNRDNAIIQRFLDNNGDWREHIDDDGDAEMDEGGLKQHTDNDNDVKVGMDEGGPADMNHPTAEPGDYFLSEMNVLYSVMELDWDNNAATSSTVLYPIGVMLAPAITATETNRLVMEYNT